MTKTLQDIAREVSDEDLETIDRLLFGEFNEALEKKSDGLDVDESIVRLESAMESLSVIREALQEQKTEQVERTASHVEDM